jgi:hypothetical protein
MFILATHTSWSIEAMLDLDLDDFIEFLEMTQADE